MTIIRVSDQSFESGIAPSEITPRATYEGRRQLLKSMALGGLGSLSIWAQRDALGQGNSTDGRPRLPGKPSILSTMERPAPYKDATTYNNFYEFGTDKSDPARNAGRLRTRPWTVSIEGEVRKPGIYDIDTLLKLAPMEERVYRLRCVEGWSMVIPWVGYSLNELIKVVEPTGNAKFVEFTTATQRDTMNGLRSPVLNWPYVEALRMDEAQHVLSMLVFGMYGEVLPNQNGAPLRLAVPWKYGFKSIKSIVKIRFAEQQPVTSWVRSAPKEYGFYANVNPAVDHPRWSQATERRIPDDGLFSPKRKTLMFNGYAAQVASLYTGMDLNQFY
ncbi:MAG: protein-methionine-sulfoxide reductase catalytic subunit MsrP [Burkholderiales bacterium]|jgi:sulfoxide reductase catalytic subunit YedY|nr:protein-methionine-sulfoxide reductase catalytic subunit MsrP [Burkholderiales bacterium]MCA3153627.1 protein-methionine-sulfoxide reductase catalytic subunit MsrP [Burkholderiales bacterium]MCA3156147.1 protein-methionine-sulfoxide reductase catalytic subunit MsrP [Burkholderiales bacterium]MCA3167387.1 protein-methionine-sulfoxide reductase catalytic subunit MsrP [Burkholderiales bacterium]